MLKNDKFPILSSLRLYLRETTKEDIEETFFLRSDLQVNKFIERSEESSTKSLADAGVFIDKISKEYIQNQSVSWSICLVGSSKMIGSICLWNYSPDMKIAEIGYALHPRFQGKGIMSESLQLVVNYGFDQLNFDQIEAYTHINNTASKLLLLKNKFLLNPIRSDKEQPTNAIFELKK